MTLRLVQIGLGGWGRNWVEEVTRDTQGVEPVAWVDLDPATRERAVIDLGLPRERVFGSLEQALEQAGPTRRSWSCPLRRTRAVTRDALEAGLHVLVEKPFTETLAEARALERLAHDRKRVLMVSQNYRWFPAPVLARRLVHDGALGHLVACYLDFHFYFGTGYRYFFLEEPLLSDMAIHHFDTLRFVLDDEPLEVSCHSWAEPDTAVRGPAGGGRHLALRQRHRGQLPRQLADPRPRHALRRSLAPGRQPRHPRIYASAARSRSARRWIA